MTVLIIEDELLAAKKLEGLIKKIKPEAVITAILDSVKNAVKWLNENKAPDIILADIQLGDGLSFDIFKKVSIASPVIFTTAYDEYALQAFKLNSIDYLLKPIEETELSDAFKKFAKNKIPTDTALLMQQIEKMNQLFQQNQAGYKTRLLVKVGERMEVVSVKDIAFFFADKKVVFLFTAGNKKYIVDESLDELQQQLPTQDFYRANRQYLIQINSVQKIHAHLNGRLKVILKAFEETEVLVPREKNTDFKKWLAK